MKDILTNFPFLIRKLFYWSVPSHEIAMEIAIEW